MRANIPDLDVLRQHLGYDPQTGELRWIADRPPAVKAGQRAGSRNGPHRDWYVMVGGRRYASHHLAWYLMRGIWPRHRVLFVDGDHDNLAWANLASEADNYSMQPAAVAYRKRRDEWARQRKLLAKTRAETRSWHGNVRYNETLDLWEAYTHTSAGKLMVIEQCKTMEAATAVSDRYIYAAAYVTANPYKEQVNDAFLTAGRNPNSVTYLELSEVIAYDPLSGGFFYRNDPAKPFADFVNTAGRRVVTFWGRYFSVGMLAWFMAHRRWPTPRAIGFRDDDPNNAKLKNLYWKKS